MGADSHRRQRALLVAAYLQSQSHASSRRQHGDKTQCSFWQFSELQKLHDLDLGSGQGHTSMHNTCMTTNLPDHVTVVSRSTEIWPFEFSGTSTFREV